MLVGAVIYSGLSVTRMQKYMTSLEVTPVGSRTLKKGERDVEVTIERAA